MSAAFMVVLLLMPWPAQKPEAFIRHWHRARKRRFAIPPSLQAAALAYLTWGCVGSPPFEAVGLSAPDEQRTSTAAAAVGPNATRRAPTALWAPAAVLSTWTEVARFFSRGHVPAASAQVETRVVANSARAASAYSKRLADDAFPLGSTLAQMIDTAVGDDTWQVAYVMERTTSGWRYFLTTSSGEVYTPGQHWCASCHQRAEHAVFGRPVVAARKALSAPQIEVEAVSHTTGDTAFTRVTAPRNVAVLY